MFYIFLLVNKKLKNKVLSIEYLHDQRAVRLTKWRKYSNNIEQFTYPVEDLEMFQSKKAFETGVNLRHKKNSKITYWIGGLEQDGIWHNRKLFENLFGKLKEDNEEY